MRLFFILGGILMTLGSVFYLKQEDKKMDIYKHGVFVDVKVIYVPRCYTNKSRYLMKFEYKKQIHFKRIRPPLCDELKVGDVIKMKTNASEEFFLYENESPFANFISWIFYL